MSQDAYDDLASLYDAFQTEADPEAWAAFLDQTCRDHMAPPSSEEAQGSEGRGLILDLGCGTGQVARALAAKAWDVIGIDNSEAMLAEATSRTEDPRVLYLKQDITAFELYGTVNAVVSTLDTLNHLDSAGLSRVLALVKNYLHPGGVFIFDLLSLDYMAEALGKEFYYDIDDDHAVLWQNSFEPDEQLNRASLTIFRRTGTVYTRADQEIVEYYHDPAMVSAELSRLGFTVRPLEAAAERIPGVLAEQRHFLLAVKQTIERDIND